MARPFHLELCGGARDERESLWVTNGINGQVDIELRPIKVVGGWPFDIQKLSDRSAEPWELRKWHKQFLCLKQ
jgi:hypothetical protein